MKLKEASCSTFDFPVVKVPRTSFLWGPFSMRSRKFCLLSRLTWIALKILDCHRTINFSTAAHVNCDKPILLWTYKLIAQFGLNDNFSVFNPGESSVLHLPCLDICNWRSLIALLLLFANVYNMDAFRIIFLSVLNSSGKNVEWRNSYTALSGQKALYNRTEPEHLLYVIMVNKSLWIETLLDLFLHHGLAQGESM